MRPSTVIGPHENIWLRGSAETAPDAVTPDSRSSLGHSWRYVSVTTGAPVYLRPLIVNSSVSTPEGLKPGGVC